MVSIQDLRVWAEKHNMYMDYMGQKKAEKIMNIIMTTFLIIAFPVGYYKQQMSISVFILLVGCLLSAIVVLPPWPCYHRNPIKWYSEPQNSGKKMD
ncbi:unnamed protein product [Heterobilharzia americana]|nr:unnamed protein product [Heterobilharzia americana]